MCFIILNATSILLFLLFPCKLVTEKTTIVFSAKPITQGSKSFVFLQSELEEIQTSSNTQAN